MKKDCKLIATITSLSNLNLVSHIISNANISEVRFNTGVRSPFSAEKSLEFLCQSALFYNKELWVDIKGRQLRVNAWADPLYECVELNHKINIKLPAKMAFRNGSAVGISCVDGNKVFLLKAPREALGKGQSVNIIGNVPEIADGYLTEQDIEYLEACKKLKIKNIMASYVEKPEDINEITNIIGEDINLCAKIESERGLTFVISNRVFFNLMAARDDMYIEFGGDFKMMLEALKIIIASDPNAICASRIFTSLENRDTPSFADYEDLEMMYQFGYRRFMLCDNVCNYAFDKAMKAWEVFTNA